MKGITSHSQVIPAFIFSLCFLTGAVFFYYLLLPSLDSPSSPLLVHSEQSSMVTEGPETPEPSPLSVDVPPIIEGTIAPGDSLYTILRRENVDIQKIMELVKVSEPLHDLSRTLPGNAYSLQMDEEGQLVWFRYQIDEQHTLVVQATADGFKPTLETWSFETRTVGIAEFIEDSLYNAIIQAGETPQLAYALADLFAWDIDFTTDIQVGDFFRLVVEKDYTSDGKFIRYGPILAAEISNGGKIFRAFYFQDPEGHSDYYNERGESLRKQFLKAPLNFRRISSGFTQKRFHPILKIYRPHLGVDYAAPTGTPVVAVGDGVVTWAGWKGGYGHFIQIKHSGNYVTHYAHLSRYAAGIRRGIKVEQGQIIGYVGSTGLSTGPHLDFRLSKNGQFINPLETPEITAEPVKSAYRKDFEALVTRRREELYQATAMITLEKTATTAKMATQEEAEVN